MKFLKRLVFCALLALAASCAGSNNGGGSSSKKEDEEKPEETKYDAYAYVTTASRASLFRKMGLFFGDPNLKSPNDVTFTGEEFQTVDGFGAALTVSSCYNLMKMQEDKRKETLKGLFDLQEGIGISLVRLCIGGSDFSYDNGASGTSSDGRFTWCDDKGIENFAPHGMDLAWVIPVLKEVYAINPNIKIIGSPWTAPRWMKENYSWTGSHLKKECYADYAGYFVRWIQYMQTEGFDIYAVTVQNEPLHGGNSMSMLMDWQECRDFVKVLGPAFKSAGLDTKIIIYDHNYDVTSYALNVMADSGASQYIAGSAWHNYGGNVSALDLIHSRFPDKGIWFTEASIGSWNYSFESCLINDFRDIFMGTLSRYGKGVVLWNLVLDNMNGPFTAANGSCTTCYGAVTILGDYKTLEPRSQYYNIAHCSKVIKSGAVRLGTSGPVKSGLSYQVYRNPDDSYGVIILNEGNQGQQLVFKSPVHSVKFSVPAKAIVSLGWKD